MKWMQVHPSHFDQNGNLTANASTVFLWELAQCFMTFVATIAFVTAFFFAIDNVRYVFLALSIATFLLFSTLLFMLASVYKAWENNDSGEYYGKQITDIG